jgi:C1A family cysteine protease
MRVLAALVAFAAVASALPVSVNNDDESYYWYEFGKFVSAYGKDYSGLSDFHGAFATFKSNLKMINTHNAAGKAYTLAMNQFGDLSFEDFLKTRTGYTYVNSTAPETHVMVGNAAASVDWRTKGVVGAVKDQGQCGSCWAFSAVAFFEFCDAQSTGKLNSLSEQQLVDCSGSYGNQGCNGGLMDNAFNYWIKGSKGADGETNYPYTARDGSCRFPRGSVEGTLRSFKDVPQADENALKDAVSTGVVSVAISVQNDFMFYSGGIYDSSSCPSDPKSLNHGVAVVGYSDGQYWIVRNSWGASWGEQGYIRMAMGKNLCGIADSASYPVV